MEDREDVLPQPGMPADSLQLQEVSVNSAVGLPPTMAGLRVIDMVAQPVPPSAQPREIPALLEEWGLSL